MEDLKVSYKVFRNQDEYYIEYRPSNLGIEDKTAFGITKPIPLEKPVEQIAIENESFVKEQMIINLRSVGILDYE